MSQPRADRRMRNDKRKRRARIADQDMQLRSFNSHELAEALAAATDEAQQERNARYAAFVADHPDLHDTDTAITVVGIADEQARAVDPAIVHTPEFIDYIERAYQDFRRAAA